MSTFPWKDFEKYRRKTLEPLSKNAVVDYLVRISYMNKQNQKNFTYKILKEYYFINNIVTYMRKNFYLLEEFDETIGHISASGLTSYWMAQQTIFTPIETKPKISSLNLFQLEGIFTIWIYGLGVSMAMFFFEFVFHICQMKLESNCIMLLRSSTFIH